ncbi:MAG: hypothetical protein OXG47_01230 [bacterium]|nr:hypothetical protein [bacterium]
MPRTKTAPRPQPPTQPAPPRPAKRADRGLTTLEWLLIVAAVAGLAALAVVLVQNVVDETAEQIAGSSARETAARVAAQAITDDTTTAHDKRQSACNRLNITYSDIGVDASYSSGTCTVLIAGERYRLAQAAVADANTKTGDGPKMTACTAANTAWGTVAVITWDSTDKVCKIAAKAG